MERYRRGHNEAVLKTVWVKAPVGSNPTFSAKKIQEGNHMKRIQILNHLQQNSSIIKPFITEVKGLVCDTKNAPWTIKDFVFNFIYKYENRFIYNRC